MIALWNETEPLIRTIYGVILIYFFLGAVGFYSINRKKSRSRARASYIKFFVYFIIINLVYWWVVWSPGSFHLLAIMISLIGLGELGYVFIRSGTRHMTFFLVSIGVLSVLSVGFYQYSLLPYTVILYVFLVVSIFDSFSQISGQLWGKRKILPVISPNKTYGGMLGGAGIAVLSAFLLKTLHPDMTPLVRLLFIGGLLFSAFAGDVLASYYKRKYEVKDFNQLIPGHGGFMDRFDSLIAAAAWSGFFINVWE